MCDELFWTEKVIFPSKHKRGNKAERYSKHLKYMYFEKKSFFEMKTRKHSK